MAVGECTGSVPLKWAKAGATVVVADYQPDKLARTCEELSELGAPNLGVEVDIRDEASVDTMVARVVDELGRVDGIINNAQTFRANAPMAEVAAEVRGRYEGVGRLVILHRVGDLKLTEAAVVVVASAPHRDEAFAAARLAIDATKATVPIWKKERWAEGESWGTGAEELRSPAEVGTHR